MHLNATSQAELKLRTPWRDGTTHLVMPEDFAGVASLLNLTQSAVDPVACLLRPGPHPLLG